MKYFNLFSKKYKKVLAFDGGGVRAIIGLYFLRKLEEESSKSIFESFDLFIGTSAGATNALMLGMNGSKIEDLEKFWTKENLKRIMNQSFIDKTSIFLATEAEILIIVLSGITAPAGAIQQDDNCCINKSNSEIDKILFLFTSLILMRFHLI